MREKKQKDGTGLLIASLITAAAFLAVYLAYSYLYLPIKTEKANARYAAMYSPETPSYEATAEPSFTAEVKNDTGKPESTVQPAETPAAAATAETPNDIKLGTPGPDTIMYLSATKPPVQESFAELIRANPETAGFLRMADGLALPVVQREGDNEYYLEHDFEGNKNNAGCLFVDGMNLLYPRDECIYIYGHNMKNGTMFGEIDEMATVEGLISRSPLRFDSIYECGVYVPFACFEITADQADNKYFEIRHFDLDAAGYAEFVDELKKRSVLDIPVDAVYGDDLLMLVTCSYGTDDGRFVVALRRLREGETEEGAMRLVELSTEK